MLFLPALRLLRAATAAGRDGRAERRRESAMVVLGDVCRDARGGARFRLCGFPIAAPAPRSLDLSLLRRFGARFLHSVCERRRSLRHRARFLRLGERVQPFRGVAFLEPDDRPLPSPAGGAPVRTHFRGRELWRACWSCAHRYARHGTGDCESASRFLRLPGWRPRLHSGAAATRGHTFRLRTDLRRADRFHLWRCRAKRTLPARSSPDYFR